MGARAFGWPRKTARRIREPARLSSGRHADAVDDRGGEAVLPLPPMPATLPVLAAAVEAFRKT